MWNVNHWWDLLKAAFCNLQRFIHLYVKKQKKTRQGSPMAVAVAVSEGWQVTHATHDMICDMWHMTHDFFLLPFCPFQYRCYYLHTSRYSVSPVCRILSNNKILRFIMSNICNIVDLKTGCAIYNRLGLAALK